MELKIRKTHSFVEIKVDEIETVIFFTDKREVESMILNLLDAVNDLASEMDKSINDYVNEM
jgi:hypothetical protein